MIKPTKQLNSLILFVIFFNFQCQNSNKNITSLPNKLEVNRIATFCKVFGGLKYFTINTNKDRIYWDKALIEIISDNPDFYKSDGGLNKAINVLYDFVKETHIPVLDNKLVEDCNLFLWLKNDSLIEESLKNKLKKILNEKHFVRNNFYFEVVNDIPVFKSDLNYNSEEFPDFSTRMLGLFNYWNFINLFNPYKNLIKGSWDAQLIAFIPQIIFEENELNYQTNYLKLFALLNDGHAFTNFNYVKDWYNEYSSNLIIKDGRISNIYKINNDLRIGDSLVSINNRSIDSLIKSLKALIPASNEACLNSKIPDFIFKNLSDTIFEIKYFRNNQLSNTYLNKSQLLINKPTQRSDTIKWEIIQNEIVYINCGNIEPKDIRNAFESVNKKDLKVILDLRKYPNHYLVDSICYFINDKPKPYVLLKSVNSELPGKFKNLELYYTISSKQKNYNLKKCVVLVNEGTGSHGEFSTMAYTTLPNTVVIGSQTAGADGDTNPILLPQNLETRYSSIGVYYPDGAQTQCVGVKLDTKLNDKEDYIKYAIYLMNK